MYKQDLGYSSYSHVICTSKTKRMTTQTLAFRRSQVDAIVDCCGSSLEV